MDRVLGIIVTYNPIMSDLIKNVEQISSQVDRLIIVDNNSKNKKDFINLEKSENVEIIYNTENVGLGKAYNSALSMHIDTYSYFATFDQDTFIPDKTLEILSSILKSNSSIGVIGPLFSRENTLVQDNGNLIFKQCIIQSSSVYRSSMFWKVGGFKENYFIDSIDFEYCLRIQANKYKVALYDGIVIKHTLGELRKRFGIYFYSHSGLRNYYIARNHVLISKEYFTRFPTFIIKKNVFFILHFFKLLILDKEKAKLIFFFKGLKDGL